MNLPQCQVVGFPSAQISWSRADSKLPQGRALFKNDQLSIINAQRNDSGIYQCKASNKLGSDSANTFLVVVELPRFTVKPPSQLDALVSQNISVGCAASGDPQPRITWIKKHDQLPVDRSDVREDGTLKIWNAEGKDSGEYTCVASSTNVFKSIAHTMQLNIKGKSTASVKGKILSTCYKCIASSTRAAIGLTSKNCTETQLSVR